MEVETGLTNDSYVEIKSGLSEGDTVYVAKSSTIPSSFMGGPGMGGPGSGMGGPPRRWRNGGEMEVMAAVVQDRVIHKRAGQCEKCGNSERSFYVPFTEGSEG